MATVQKRKKLPTEVSPKGIAGFSWLSKPDSGGKYSDDKYKVTLFLEKGVPVNEKFADMLNKAHIKARGRKQTALPVKDGDEINADLLDQGKEEKDENRGMYRITFKSKYPAQILEGSEELPLDKAPKSGDKIKVAFAMAPYSEGKNAGISLQLRAVKVVERRAGADYSDAFGDDEDYEDSEENESSDGEDNGDFS